MNISDVVQVAFAAYLVTGIFIATMGLFLSLGKGDGQYPVTARIVAWLVVAIISPAMISSKILKSLGGGK